MALRLGIVADNADVVDYQTKGNVQLVQIRASGITKRACKRGARKEASKYITTTNQEFVNQTKLASPRMGQVWLFTVSERN